MHSWISLPPCVGVVGIWEGGAVNADGSFLAQAAIGNETMTLVGEHVQWMCDTARADQPGAYWWVGVGAGPPAPPAARSGG